MQNCTKCGATNNPDSKFCFTCGNPLGESPVNSVQAQQPSQPNQAYQPMQPQQAQQPNQAYQPAQPQQPYPSMQPQQPYQHNMGAGHHLPPFVTPQKKSKSIWAIIGSGIVTVAALIYLLIQFTSIGTTVMGWFGLDKSEQLVDYYNNIHMPIFLNEVNLEDDMNTTLLANDQPDWDLVLQKASVWKKGYTDAKTSYSNAEVKNSEIKLVNDLSIQRTEKMELAMEQLMVAILQSSSDIYDNKFMTGVDEYYRLFEQWNTEINKLFEKHDITLSGN